MQQTTDANAQPQAPREPLGRVISISGSQAQIGLLAASRLGGHDPRATVGKFIGIRAGRVLQVGMITEVTAQPPAVTREQGHYAVAQVDLMGEIKEGQSGKPHFVRGVREYPSIGDPADLIGNRALRLIYDLGGGDTMDIGTLNQDSSVGAYVHVEDMISKHFAVLGTTGVGKSSAVVVLLQRNS